MPQVHESSLFRQVSDGKVGEDATTTLGNGTVIREDFTDARSKNARTRRDEKTLDVATDVYVVKTDMPGSPCLILTKGLLRLFFAVIFGIKQNGKLLGDEKF